MATAESREIPLKWVPCSDGRRPVVMVERLGMQIGLAT
jgi:hypothetical protein